MDFSIRATFCLKKEITDTYLLFQSFFLAAAERAFEDIFLLYGNSFGFLRFG